MHFQSFSSYMTRYRIYMYILYLVSNHHLRRICRISRFPSLGSFITRFDDLSARPVTMQGFALIQGQSELEMMTRQEDTLRTPKVFTPRWNPNKRVQGWHGWRTGWSTRTWNVTWMGPLKRKNLETWCFCFILGVIFQVPCSFWRVYWSVMGSAFLVGVWCTS